MNKSPAYLIMEMTFRRTLAARLLLLWIVTIFFLSINLPVLSLIISSLLPSGYEVTNLPFFVALTVPFVPLLALGLGSASITDERQSGTLMYVLSNPITKSDFYIGRWAGLSLATSLAVVLGYGAASAFVFGTNLAGYSSVSVLIVVAVTLNLTMVGLALLISTVSSRKYNALVAGLFLWFLMTSLFEYIISLAYSLPTDAIQLVFGAVMANPAGMAQTLAGLLGGGSSLAGANGAGSLSFASDAISETLVAYLGASNVVPVLSAAVLAWTVGLFSAGFLLFTKRDLVIGARQGNILKNFLVESRHRYPHLPRNLAVGAVIVIVATAGYFAASSAAVSSSPFPPMVTVSGIVNPQGDNVIPLSLEFDGSNGHNFTTSVAPGGSYQLVLPNKITYNTTLTYRDISYNMYYCGLGLLDLASHTNTTTFSATCATNVDIGL